VNQLVTSRLPEMVSIPITHTQSRHLGIATLQMLLLLVVATLLLYTAGCAGRTVQMTGMSQGYEVADPSSRLVMIIPITGLVPGKTGVGGATNNPRYFALVGEQSPKLILSGWFEPAQQFKGVPILWEEQRKEWARTGQPEPQDIVFGKVGQWDVILYDLRLPQLALQTNAHMRAQWIQAGTWIDLHLSLTSSQSSRDARAQLVEKLKSIQVREN